MRTIKKLLFAVFAIAISINAYSQSLFPLGDYWSLSGGIGTGGFHADGGTIALIVEPKLWISPQFMVGAKLGASFSFEDSVNYSNTIFFDAQAFFRWNFWRFGNERNPFNVFAQAGLGLIAAYRGNSNPFDNVEETRGRLMADLSAGITIPLTDRWVIEPSVRFGYPHLWGVAVTAGFKFRLPERTVSTTTVQQETVVEYVEVLQALPPNEVVKRIMITAIEYILFGPDIGRYNIGIDRDAQGLNELVLNYMAQVLKDNPNYVVRIEGHANPVTTDPREADELMVLSTMRSNAVAAQLRSRGVPDNQIVIIAFGGTRTVIEQSDTEHWNRNRRVELILVQVDTE